MKKRFKKVISKKLRIDDKANLRNSLISGGGHVVTVLGLLITVPLLLTKLGKDGTGIVMLAKSVLGVGGMMSLGMGQATLKFVSKYNALGDRSRVFAVINTTLSYYALLGGCAGFVVFFGAEWLATAAFKIASENQAAATLAFQVAGVGLIGTLISDAIGAALKGFERFDLVVTTEVIMQLVLLVGQVAVLLGGHGIVEIVMVLVAGRVLNVGMKAWLLCGHAAPGLRLYPQFDREVIRESFGYGVYTWVGDLLNKVRTEGPPFVLGASVGTEAVAIYNIAVRLLSQFVSLLSSASAYLFPYISRVHEQGDHESVRRHYHQVTTIMVVLSAAGITPIFVCSEPVLQWWLKEDVAPQVMVIVQILAIRFAVLPLGIVNYSFVVATNRVKALVVVQLVGTFVMVAGTLIGAKMGGLEGAAWGQLSVFITIIGNRLYVERSLFKEVNPILHLSILLAVALPLLLGLHFTLEANASWLGFLFGSLIWALVGGFVAWGIMALGQWITSVTTPRRMPAEV